MTGHESAPDVEGQVAPRADGLGMTWRVGVLVAVAVACAVIAFSGAPVRDSIQYFDFADVRSLLGIPSAMNVLSSGAFVAAGLSGIAAMLGGRVTFRDGRERAPWLVFFAGVTLAGLGTGAFHLDPSAASLALDRFPMTLGFTGLIAALLAERVDAAWGRRLLWPLVGLGLASMVWWWVTDRTGAVDLRPYMLVQFFSLLAVPLLLLLFPSPYSGSSLYLLALGLYVIGKVAEGSDGEIFRMGGIVSGHTLKHLLSAAAVGVVAWMLVRREPLERGLAAPADSR